MKKYIIIFLTLFAFLSNIAVSQTYVDYTSPKKYEIAGISVSGIKFLSKDALITLSGLGIGMEIAVPGSDIADAIDKLWKQGLFSDVKISIVKIEGNKIYLDIFLQEQPRLSKLVFYGINKSQQDDLREKLNLKAGKQVTKNLIRNSKIIVENYYAEKGFHFVDVKFKIVDDPDLQNVVNLHISIDKNHKVKIKNIVIRGNSVFTEKKIRRIFKDTKEKKFYRFWKTSKYIEDKFDDDKKKLIAKYNKLGYRDAAIVEDSVYVFEDNLNIYIKIYEGKKYYFRNIEWVGNQKYSTHTINRFLGLKKGDPYNQEELQNRLYSDPDAVGNLYYDDGYLFFQATPQEVKIDGDSVDIRIVIVEGQQAVINRIIINGNTRTNERVIRRELVTLPGQLFSKTDLIRSVRELANLGNFDPEQLAPVPIPNQSEGNVDIKFNVVERANDMFEISGGYGHYGFTGRVGITFNNFSIQNIFKKEYWDPLPMGDGQKLSLSAMSGGPRYQFYSLSFMEPWMGGKKKNSFSTSIYYNRNTNAYSIGQKPTAIFQVVGVSFGLGRRIRWPDDYFVLSHQLSLDRYVMDDYPGYINVGNGSYNIISLTNTLSRSSIDNPLFTRSGADISIALKMTPPYSLFKGLNSWGPESDVRKYKWAELYKVNVKAAWYNNIVQNLVISTRFEFGFVGYYNKQIGYSPFEGFDLGGDGMAYYSFGKDIVGLRGYKNSSLNPSNGIAHLYSKYTVELRYPLLLKEMATLYVLGFLEGGEAWYSLNEFNPFKLHRSAGLGARLFVPMLGLVGVDFGYGFDPEVGSNVASGWNYHLTFGQQF